MVKNNVNINISSEEEFEVLENQLYLKNDLCQYLKEKGVTCNYVVNASGKSFMCGLANRPKDGKKCSTKEMKHHWKRKGNMKLSNVVVNG